MGEFEIRNKEWEFGGEKIAKIGKIPMDLC